MKTQQKNWKKMMREEEKKFGKTWLKMLRSEQNYHVSKVSSHRNFGAYLVVKYAKIANLVYCCLLFKPKWPKVTVVVTPHESADRVHVRCDHGDVSSL
jgi:hypothetical protein